MRLLYSTLTLSLSLSAAAAFTTNVPTKLRRAGTSNDIRTSIRTVTKHVAPAFLLHATIPRVADAVVDAVDAVDAAYVDVTSSTTKQKQSQKKNKSSFLDLNEDGHLILADGRTLLDGLNPKQWQASSIIDDTVVSDTTNENSNNSNDNDIDSVMLHVSSFQSDTELPIGQLLPTTNVLAVSRLSKYWMGPAFRSIPFDTQFLLVEITPEQGDDNDNRDDQDDHDHQQYALILPLVDAGFRASLESNPQNKQQLQLICHAENGNTESHHSDDVLMKALYVAVGNDPFALLARGFEQVATSLGTFRPLSQKQLPPTVNDFGWCTWDAFYSTVDPAGILQGVQSLRDAKVPPRTLILDDGWQQVAPPKEDETDEPVKTTAMTTDTNNNDDESILTKISAFLMSIVVTVIGGLYEKFVKRAPHGSFPNLVWKTLSHTVLKGGLWFFFDSQTDFGRQLNGVAPNDKFETTNNKNDATNDSSSTGNTSLKDLVSTLKNDMGLHRVYCWHALHGYWRGVSSELGDALGIDVCQVTPHTSKHVLKVQPELSWDPVALFGVGMLTTQKDIDVFYKHMHAPLVAAGVDGVKIDVQSGVSAVGARVGDGGPHLAKMYNEAMENSVAEHFVSDNGGVDCINCMCHSTENLYRYHATSVARASEDFFPDRSDSQTVHIVNVAYNSLFLGEICLPDWDMFHSLHESAPLHAAARAVGGCPVYVSDKPGRHDAALLRKLVLPDGSVLRANLPGRPTRDCLFADVGTDGTSALKIWNQNNVGGVVGAFHVQGVEWNFDTHENEVVDENPAPITATVRPKDIQSLRGKEGPFCAWRHQTATLELLESDSSEMTVDLNHREWEIFTIVPVQTTSDVVMWGPIGLADMMNSGGGLLHADEPLEQTTTMNSDGKTSTTTAAGLSARGPGRFVAYSQPAPTRVLIDGTSVKELQFDHDEKTGKLTFDLPNENSEGEAHRLTVVWDQLD